MGGVLQALSEWGSKAQRDSEEKYEFEGSGCLTLGLYMLRFCVAGICAAILASLQLSNCFRFSSSERKKENHSCTCIAFFCLCNRRILGCKDAVLKLTII
jgi:hypothetical protein